MVFAYNMHTEMCGCGCVAQAHTIHITKTKHDQQQPFMALGDALRGCGMFLNNYGAPSEGWNLAN
jgi:hypothetical protein